MESVVEPTQATSSRTDSRRKLLDDCLEACAECELACIACADACLGERQLDALRTCIRLNLDCADACDVSARILARRLLEDTDFLRAQLDACGRICASCGAECLRHAGHHEHCRICADVCLRCERQCRETIRRLKQDGVSQLDAGERA